VGLDGLTGIEMNLLDPVIGDLPTVDPEPTETVDSGHEVLAAPFAAGRQVVTENPNLGLLRRRGFGGRKLMPAPYGTSLPLNTPAL